MNAVKRRRVRSCCEAGLGSSLLLQGIACLSKVPLFASLPPAELPRVAALLRNLVHEPGQVVIRQGDPGHQLFIIQDGAATMSEVSPDGETGITDELKPGSYFGMSALLRGSPFPATVVATEAMTVWVLERSDLEKLGLRNRLHFSKRRAVHEVNEGPKANASDETAVKSEDELTFLTSAMLANATLAPLLEHLSDAEARAIVDSACRRRVPKGDCIFRQGEMEAELFYIVEEGVVECLVDGRVVRQFARGESFGASALLFWEPRRSTERAATDATLWALPRLALRRITQGPLRQRLDEYAELLHKVPGLVLPPTDVAWSDVANALQEMTFFKGEYVVEIGEGQCLYILYAGHLAMEVGGVVVRELEARGEFFGERALLEDGCHEASVRVVSERAQVLSLDRRAISQLQRSGHSEQRVGFGIPDASPNALARAAAARRAAAATGNGSACGGACAAGDCARSLSELEEIGVMGWGSYAKVSLVRCKCRGSVYALKSLSKGRILQRRQIKNVQTERLVLKSTRSEFVIRLIGTFKTDTHLSFLMEPAMGGDLCTVFERSQLYYSARHARFYVACAVQGLEHLHERWIANRDLKLENMLLDERGYCKLADFGLAKFVIGHTFTLCGTPDYMAPEVIGGTGHTRSVDWWALGVVLYALMAGVLPFDAPRPPQIFAKAKRGIEPVLEITGFGNGKSKGDWTDVVRNLCKLDPSERLPARKGGADNLRHHPWFARACFDWRDLCQCTMRPPYAPCVRGSVDLSNFDPNPEDAPPDVPYYDPGDNWDDDFDELPALDRQPRPSLARKFITSDD